MSLKTSDLLIYPNRCQTSDVLAGLENTISSVTAHAEEFLSELEAACLESGIDFAYAAAHSANETDYWTSFYFVNRRNGFGIGITGEPGVDGPLFPSYMACAQFFAAELLMKVRKPLGNFTSARQYAPQKYDDVKAIVAGSLGTFPTVERIADLGTHFGPNGRECVWYCDDSGAEAIVQKARALIPNVANQTTGGPIPVPTPSKVTFGNVPHPDYIDRLIPSSQNSAWDDLGQRTVRGIVWHRMLGSLDGTEGFFRGGAAALTDYGTGVSAQDGAGEDGLLDRWNDPEGRRSPWANGALSQPYGDGLAFFNIYGVNAINRDLTAIEISGFQTTPVSTKARRTIVELTAYWADRYHVSWETFPLIPAEGNRSFVIWHQEITIGTGKECPFDEVMKQTVSLIAETKDYLKSKQTEGIPVPPPPKPKPPKPPKYPRPILPAGLHADIVAGAPHDHVVDGVTYRATKSVWRANRGTRRMQQPIEVTEKAKTKVVSVGPSLKANTALTAWWETDRTLITRAGTSFYKNAFRPITVAVARTLRATEHPIEE